VKIRQKAPDPMYGLPPTLATRIWLIKMMPAIAVKFGSRHTILIPIVTFSQAPVMENRYRRIAESYFGRLSGPSEIGREDGLDSIMASALAEFFGQHAPFLREPAVMPARCNSSVVILAY
jgi:hypothetical protein